MANKRQLKKFIRNFCGAAAAEILLARAAFPQMDRKKVYDIVKEIASLQSAALNCVTLTFPQSPDAFENSRQYSKARKAYFREAYSKLIEGFDAKMTDIVKKMNEALPEEARKEIKEFISAEK